MTLEGLHYSEIWSNIKRVTLGRNFDDTIGVAVCEASSATWNLGTNSAFALVSRKTMENLDGVGQKQDLPAANWLLSFHYILSILHNMDRTENTASTVRLLLRLFVAAGTCLPRPYLTTFVSSGSTILTFRHWGDTLTAKLSHKLLLIFFQNMEIRLTKISNHKT
jgi:hypothetical protein